jgi:hypothetical protein
VYKVKYKADGTVNHHKVDWLQKGSSNILALIMMTHLVPWSNPRQ